MDDSEANGPTSKYRVSGGRVFESHRPTTDDIEKARQLSADACPRRYCWWWRSLSFDWDVPVDAGCTFLTTPKPSSRTQPNVACVRCDSGSSVDQFEPREPHMLEDGIDGTAWFLQSFRVNGTAPRPGWEDYFLPGWVAKHGPLQYGDVMNSDGTIEHLGDEPKDH